MPSTAIIVCSLLFASVGFGYFIYGRKQDHVMAKYAGIALMVFPYFVTDVYLLVLVGVILLALPLLLKP